MIPRITAHFDPCLVDLFGWSDPDDTNFMVITGQNASGKSFIRRLLSAACKIEGIEAMALSMEQRTQSGVMSAMIYGDETHEATGVLSGDLIYTGWKSARLRTRKHILLFDEPELGMGEELQHAACNHIVDQIADWHELLQGVVIMTHSRIFAERMVNECNATFRNMDGHSLDSWLHRDVRNGPTLEELREISYEQYQKIHKAIEVLKSRKK